MPRRHAILAVPRKRAVRPLPAEKPARVCIVVADSQTIDRGGLIGLLENEKDFEVVGEAASVDEALEQCRALKPDVLVLSLNLPGQEEGAAISVLRASLPDLAIVALSERGTQNCLVLNPPSRRRGRSDVSEECIIRTDCLQLAVTQGAMATVRRSADPGDLFRAVRSAASGSALYDPATTAGLMLNRRAGHPREGARGAPLSPREREVAARIAEGRSNKEISVSLGISEPTVKKHVGHLLDKLGVDDRLQAGLYLARNPLALEKAT